MGSVIAPGAQAAPGVASTNASTVATSSTVAPSPVPLAPKRPTLFLSCPLECFDEFLRQELNYFDFVRDPHSADLTIVVVRQRAANGGERFTVTLVHPLAAHTRKADASQSFTADFGQTAAVARQQLLQVILRMLQLELANTPDFMAFELSLPKRDGLTLSSLNDAWDYWVIAPELLATANGGSGYYFAELTGALNVRRITEESKFRFRAAYDRKWTGLRLEDGSRLSGDVFGVRGRGLYALSLGDHWALGAVASVSSERYTNLRAHVHGGPLVEFNVFPYTDNASQQLRLAYQAGAWANVYFERNRLGRKRDLFPYHALSLIAEANQYWGSVQWVGQVNAFVSRPALNRASTGAIVNLRLFEGFAVGVEGVAALVNDQINLRQRQITDDEIVLWTAEQATDHMFEVAFIVSYAFGSSHNTIVNPRFARVDLDEE